MKLLLDIRSTEEWNQGHLPNAVHVETPLPPLSPSQICVLASKLNGLFAQYGAETEYAVYCKKGKRSSLAAAILRVLGAANVVDLGGIE